jgi:hypothetical protein
MTAELISFADRIKNIESTLFGGPNVAGDVPDIGLVDQVTAIEDSAVIVRNIRRRCTTSEINAGVELLPAVPGFKYRMIDCTLIAIGGAAATATAVTVNGTQAASGVALITAAVAALTRSTIVKPNTGSVTVLADGASNVLNDVNTNINVGKTGGSLATATAVDVILTYTLEAA